MSKRTGHSHRGFPFRKSWLLLGMMAGVALPGMGHGMDIATVSYGGDGAQNPKRGDCSSARANGACTLRAAIQLANTTAGPDRIILSPNIAITLSESGSFEDAGDSGDLDITDDLIIEGNNATIQAQNGDRVFHIQNGASVTLRNMKITGGSLNIASAADVPKGEIPGGAGILVQGASTLNLESVNLTFNTLIGYTTNFTLTGGGLYVDLDATVNIKDSQITSNRGPGGGGITNLGRTEIRDTTISSNTDNNSEAGGGGIRNMGGYLNIGNTTLSKNRSGLGGGISNISAGPNVGNLIISNCWIDGNIAGRFGGGIYNLAPVTMSNSTVSNNESTLEGGGIYNSALGNMDIINSTISSNNGRSGGGIFNSREITLTNVTLYNNNSTPCTANCVASFDQNTQSENGALGGNQFAIFNSGLASSPSLTLTNTIIANGGSSNPGTTACSGPTTPVLYTTQIHSSGGNLEAKTAGVNLAGDGHSCGLTTALKTPDIIDATSLGLDPLLAPDAASKTNPPVHALLPNSAAIDNANRDLCPEVDQRFLLRSDGLCDIGAYEFGAKTPMDKDRVDLKLTISDNVDPVRPNDPQMPLTYKVVLTNLYVNASARGVVLEIKLPIQYFSFTNLKTTSTTTKPVCDETPDPQGILRCTMDTLPGLGRVEVFVTGFPTVDGVTITTEAGVTSDTKDAFLPNNHVTEDTVVDRNAKTTLNFGGTSAGGGGGGTLHPLWLLTLGGLMLTRRQRRY